jgi:hypothetical protein
VEGRETLLPPEIHDITSLASTHLSREEENESWADPAGTTAKRIVRFEQVRLNLAFLAFLPTTTKMPAKILQVDSEFNKIVSAPASPLDSLMISS